MKEFEEFAKVSIHQHFGGEYTFDRTLSDKVDKTLFFDWDYSIDILKDALKNNYDLLAMTNSNVFDSTRLLLLRKIAKNFNVEVIPGVEITLENKDKNKYAHVVVLFDPKENFLNIEISLTEFLKINGHNYITQEQFVDFIIGRKVIIIPHGVKQSNGGRSLSVNPNLISYFYSMDSSIPIMIEDNQQYHKETLKRQVQDFLDPKIITWLNGVASVSGADRQKLSEIDSPTFIWGDPHFSDLYYAALMKDNDGVNTRIRRKEDIIRKIGYIKTISIRKSTKTLINSKNLYCSHGLNTIIGPSGSGKTLLLNLINKKLSGYDLSNVSIVKNNYDAITDVDDIVLYDENNEIINTNDIGVFEGQNLYNLIIEAYQSNKSTLLQKFRINIDDSSLKTVISNFQENFNKYIDNMKKLNTAVNEIKRIIQSITSTQEFLDKNTVNNNYRLNYKIYKDYDDQIQNNKLKEMEFINDKTRIEEAFNAVLSIAKKYDITSEFDSLTNSKSIIIKRITRLKAINDIEMIELKRKKEIKQNLFRLVQNHNKIMGEILQQINQKEQDLLNYNTKLLMTSKIIYTLRKYNSIPTLSPVFVKNGIKLKNNQYAQIQIKETKLSIKKEDLTTVFSKNVGQRETDNKIGLSNFSSSEYDLSNSKHVSDLTKPFIEKKGIGDVSLDLSFSQLVEYDIALLTLDREFIPIENITAGMLSKIYLQKMFDDSLKGKNSKTIIVYDQPDVNMEKEFILTELVRKIQELKNHYQIFITTHEPLLVINADSNNIIRCQNNKKITKKLEINYENISLHEVESKSKAFNLISKLIDGSSNAVKFRSKIYGGMTNES